MTNKDETTDKQHEPGVYKVEAPNGTLVRGYIDNPDLHLSGLSDHRPKVAGTVQMHQLTADAAKLMYNRVLAGEALAMLDPDGHHVLVPMMLHAHAKGKPTDPHVRALAYLKLRDNDTPEQVIVDVPMRAWHSLRFADEYLTELKARRERDAGAV